VEGKREAAWMTLSASPSPDASVLVIPNRREDIERAEEMLLAAMERHQYPDAARFAVRLALEESLVNAFRHGHKNLPVDTPARVEFSVNGERVELAIEDQGPGFKPEDVPDPTLDENIERPTGRGLLLMRAYMARVEYVGRGNRVEMTYQRPAGTP
jgi:serine/threonine-protein kinase RsbW